MELRSMPHASSWPYFINLPPSACKRRHVQDVEVLQPRVEAGNQDKSVCGSRKSAHRLDVCSHSKSCRMPRLYSRDLEHCASNRQFWKSDSLAKFCLRTYVHSFLVGSPDQYFGGPRGVCTTEPDECIWIHFRVSWYSWKFWDTVLRCGGCNPEICNISLNAKKIEWLTILYQFFFKKKKNRSHNRFM